jgi:mannitol/fructose-specific phosphotransferase system IIA component (Ntr-type)
MALVDYVCETAVCMHLPSQERDEAIRALLEQCVSAEIMPARLKRKAFDAILQRERLGSTAIGKGVAVPHARLEEVDRIVVAFGYSAEGIEFSALDGEPVHLVFLVLASRQGAEQYLNVMQRITRLVQNEDFRRFVAHAGSTREIVDLIKEMDG